MKRYTCHKKVHAGIITSMTSNGTSGATIYVGDETFDVDREYMDKHKPKVGGVFIVYKKSGYRSFSPVEPFEDGYSLDGPEIDPPGKAPLSL